MNDTELDEELARMSAELPASVREEARRLVLASRPLPARGMRRRWVLPVAVAAAVALTAGASAAVMNWAGVGIIDGTRRNSIPIPVDFHRASGEFVHCGAFVDLEKASVADIDRLDAAIRGHDWTGFGERLYAQADPGPVSRDDSEQLEREHDRFDPLVHGAVQRFVEDVLPGVTWLDLHATGLNVSATGFVCRPDVP